MRYRYYVEGFKTKAPLRGRPDAKLRLWACATGGYTCWARLRDGVWHQTESGSDGAYVISILKEPRA